MGPEAAHIAASLAKSQEVQRSPGVTQRASDVEQAQFAAESASAHSTIKADAAEHIETTKRKHERERRRRELERQGEHPAEDEGREPGDGSTFDMVA